MLIKHLNTLHQDLQSQLLLLGVVGSTLGLRCLVSDLAVVDQGLVALLALLGLHLIQDLALELDQDLADLLPLCLGVILHLLVDSLRSLSLLVELDLFDRGRRLYDCRLWFVSWWGSF